MEARSHRANPSIGYDILIHKVDGDMFLSEDHKSPAWMEVLSEYQIEN